MGVIQEFFNNREIAIGIWVIIGLAVILPTKPARQFIKTAIPILFCKKFVIFYIVFLSFLGLVLFALNWAGLWDLTLLKDTVFWVLFVELPLFAKAIEKADGGRFFSKLIRENVAIVVAIEFFVGFWTFSLITEIILIPLTVLISVLQVLAGQDKKHRSAKRFFDGLLVLWGIILLINAIYSLIHAPNQFLSFDTLKSTIAPAGTVSVQSSGCIWIGIIQYLRTNLHQNKRFQIRTKENEMASNSLFWNKPFKSIGYQKEPTKYNCLLSNFK